MFIVFAYTRIGPDPGRRFDTTKRGYVLSATQIFPRARLEIVFSPFILSFFPNFFSVERCWPAGPKVRRCVCPKGDFDQTQSIPLNLHAHPRRALWSIVLVVRMQKFCRAVLVATRLCVEN
ncbi:hypothetical protein PUN28_001048 [Cardiocondyla obscurior]|uniref:Uncharacterized protein n=1 Tax=Cardiocondyla obscurior TaxID=286306 RepID=A0AAW2H2N5_9HYME